jgi:hypothetical protein
MRKLILAIAAPLALLFSAGPAPAYHDALGTVEGEHMTGVGRIVEELDLDATSGGALRRLEDNGRVTADLPITEPATNVTIYARAGQQCGGAWPRFTVRVGGALLGTVVVDSVRWEPFSIPVELEPGTHRIELTYVNDLSTTDCERWLRIDRVELRHDAWRAFPKDSVWNRPAAEKGTFVPNPFADDLWLTYGDGLLVGGGPCGSSDHDFEYRKPIYFAEETDPVTTLVTKTIPSWDPRGELRWDGRPIPIPRGVRPAEGSDGHLTIVSADRKTAFEFWRATSVSVLGITAATVTMYDLTGPGYSTLEGNNAARGSGMPVISNSLRAEEAFWGFHHALVFDVPSVGSDYIPPASKSDGDGGPLQYGQLFVLRPDFPIPASAPRGVKHVLQALKTFGAYIGDQGSNWQIDTDSSSRPALWCASGVDRNSFEDIVKPSDLMLVQPDAPAAP